MKLKEVRSSTNPCATIPSPSFRFLATLFLSLNSLPLTVLRIDAMLSGWLMSWTCEIERRRDKSSDRNTRPAILCFTFEIDSQLNPSCLSVLRHPTLDTRRKARDAQFWHVHGHSVAEESRDPLFPPFSFRVSQCWPINDGGSATTSPADGSKESETE